MEKREETKGGFSIEWFEAKRAWIDDAVCSPAEVPAAYRGARGAARPTQRRLSAWAVPLSQTGARPRPDRLLSHLSEGRFLET